MKHLNQLYNRIVKAWNEWLKEFIIEWGAPFIVTCAAWWCVLEISFRMIELAAKLFVK